LLIELTLVEVKKCYQIFVWKRVLSRSKPKTSNTIHQPFTARGWFLSDYMSTKQMEIDEKVLELAIRAAMSSGEMEIWRIYDQK